MTSASFKELGNIDDLNKALILSHKYSTKISAFSLVLVFSVCFVSLPKAKKLKVVPIQGFRGLSFMTSARKVKNFDPSNNPITMQCWPALYTTIDLYTPLTPPPSPPRGNVEKSIKTVNIDGQNFISSKRYEELQWNFQERKQCFTLYLEDKFFEKPQEGEWNWPPPAFLELTKSANI